MSILHDHALLGPQEIREALPDSDLAEQVERVRITLHPTSLDELSKLWTAFQTEYRLSVAYEASVVLLDSTLPATTPLPVLRRGTDDRGVIVVLGSLPRVDRLRMPGPEPTAELGDTLTIAGRNLTGDSVRVLLRHPLVERPFERRPLDGASAESLTVKLPDPGDPADDNSPAARWPAGFYTVTVVTTRTGEPTAAATGWRWRCGPGSSAVLPPRSAPVRPSPCRSPAVSGYGPSSAPWCCSANGRCPPSPSRSRRAPSRRQGASSSSGSPRRRCLQTSTGPSTSCA